MGGIARLHEEICLNKGALAIQAAALAVAWAAYSSDEAKIMLKALAGIFAYGLSDAKLYAFILAVFLAATMSHLKPRAAVGRAGLACLLLLSAGLYVIDAAEYLWMVEGLGGDALSKYYAVSDGYYSSTSLMHIHNGKAAAPALASALGFGHLKGGYDVGVPYASLSPTWLLSVQSLAYIIFLALALLAIQDIRLRFGADVVSAYTITAYAVAKTIFDGGPFMHEAVIAYPIFAATVVAAYAAGRYAPGERMRDYRVFYKSVILMLAVSLASYIAFLTFLYGRVMTKVIIYPYYWLTEPLAIIAAAYMLLHRPRRPWQAAVVLAALILLAPPIQRNLKSAATLEYMIPAGTEAGVMHPVGAGRLSAPHDRLLYEVIGGYVVENVRFAEPVSIIDIAGQTGDSPGYDHIFFQADGCSLERRSLHLLLHTEETPPTHFKGSGFASVREIKMVGASTYSLDVDFTNCAPNPMFLLSEYLSANGMGEYVLENAMYRPTMGA